MKNLLKKIAALVLSASLLVMPGEALAQFAPGPPGTGTGTVTSVGLAMPSIFTVSSSPVITVGTLTATLNSAAQNAFFAGPIGASGTPTFRSIGAADLPGSGIVTGGVITGTFPALTIGASQIVTGMIGAGAVATNQMALMPDATIHSNISGVSAVPSNNTITAVLDKQLGSTNGNIPVRTAGVWTSATPQSTIPAASLTGSQLVNATVTTTQIAPAAITTAQLATPAASGASMVLLGSVTGSGLTDLHLNGLMSSTYDAYKLIFTAIAPSTATALPVIQWGNGGTYVVGTAYAYGAWVVNVAGTTAAVNSASSGGIALSNGLPTTATLPMSGSAEFSGISNASIYKPVNFSTRWSDGTTWASSNGVGLYGGATTAFTDVRLTMTAGNISGTLYLYGIRPN